MTEEITSYKFACVVARFLEERIASDISILNISNVSSFADYFVICSAQTSTQVKVLFYPSSVIHRPKVTSYPGFLVG